MKILMLTESTYPNDPRVKQEAELLTLNGHIVSVICIKEKRQIYYEKIHKVKVYRVPKIEIFKVGKQIKTGKYSLVQNFKTITKAVCGYGFEYVYFTLACFIITGVLMFLEKPKVIHSHNPPDTLFTVGLFYKLFFKRKYVYDHHDLSPDLFLEKYSENKNIIFKVLLLLEKYSCKSADFVIATNDSYKNIEIERNGISQKKIYIVRNGPDLEIVKVAESINFLKQKNKTILCYLGSINIQDGVQYLLYVLHKIVNKYNIHNILLLIVGDGDYLIKIRMLTRELKLEKYIIFAGYLTDRNELNRYLSTADIFVDAAPKTFLNDNSTFIKLMEYMAFGKPVVSFALKESINSLKNAGLFVSPNDINEMATKIIELANNEKKMEKLGKNAFHRVKEISWEKVSKPLLELYQLLEKQTK